MRFGDAMASDWPMQTICTSLQTDTHMGTQTPHLSIFAGRMPFLMPNQQCQSTEGNYAFIKLNNKFIRLISGSLDQRQCIHLVLDRHLSNRHHLPVGRWMEVGPSGQLLTSEWPQGGSWSKVQCYFGILVWVFGGYFSFPQILPSQVKFRLKR